MEGSDRFFQFPEEGQEITDRIVHRLQKIGLRLANEGTPQTRRTT